MRDTSPEIIKKQIEIILSKTEAERFRIGEELNLFGRKIVESSIRQENPEISETDLKIEVFKRCYSAFFSQKQMDKIIHSMRDFLLSSEIG